MSKKLPKKTKHPKLGDGVYVHYGDCRCYICAEPTKKPRYATRKDQDNAT